MNRRGAWRPAVAALLAILPFLPSLNYGFLYEWDDANFILDNPYIGMSWANLLHNFTTNLQTVYTPLTTFSLMIDHALFGTWAPGYHAVQLLMLGGCAALLFGILRKLRVPASAALLLTLLWAWNPGKCETAAWIADRKGMGCTLFALAAFLSFLRDCRREKAGAGTVLLMFAAFLFKPSALPLPGVMALYAWCRFPGEWGKLFRLLWPVGAAGIAGGALVSAMTFSELSGSHASGIADAANLLRYFGAAVWPFSLNPIHPRLTLPEMLPELLWAAAVLAAVIWAGRKSRVPNRFQMAFAAGFVFLALPLLSSGALTNSNYAERYNFLLSAAVWCWIGVAGRGLFRRLPRVSAWAAGILLAGYLLTDWFYLETFSDTRLLFGRAAAVENPAQRALEGLGEVAINRQLPELLYETGELFNRASSRQEPPRDAQFRNTAVLLAAHARLMAGMAATAEELAGVLRSNGRDAFVAPEIFLPPAYSLAAGKLAAVGKAPEAAALLEKQVADGSGVEFQLHFAAGLAGYFSGDRERAAREWRRVLELKPRDGQTRRNLELVEAQLGSQ